MYLAGTETLRKVVVLNPKGGSGKTTLAFSLAGYLAGTGRTVALLDMDKQGSSRRWLQNRSTELPAIQSLPPPDDPAGTITIPPDIDVVVIDAPAALPAEELADYTCGMHAVLVPVLPSDMDIHAASRLVSDLLLKAQVSRRNGRLGIVANRVKERTIAYRQLMRFLESLSIKLIGVLRDSQNYTHAAAAGRCLHEMAASQVKKDVAQWSAITNWLEDRLAEPLTPRDWLRPSANRPLPGRRHRLALPAAAAVGTIAVAAWLLAGPDLTATDASLEPVHLAVESRVSPTDSNETYWQGVASLPDESDPITEIELAIEPVEVPVADAATRWRLKGVVQNGDTRVLVLNDQSKDSTVNLSVDAEVDGWSVADSGSNFAVLRNDDREVRLALNEEQVN